MYKTRLEQDGFTVVIADNGNRGIETAMREKPDLILLDVMIPQIDGFSVLQRLRSEAMFEKTPIIMLTNLGTVEDMEKGKKLGATDYLVKASLTPAEVAKIVTKYVK
jgi:DNA-binding response OmpR family regulator